MAKCERCGGTGYGSAAREAGLLGSNLPFYMIPLGVWTCDYCGGTGKDWEPPVLSDADKEMLKSRIEQLLACTKGDSNG